MKRPRLMVALVLVCALAASGLAATRAYFVEPRTASESGWTPLYGNVSEIVTCNWDELDSSCYVELLVNCACALGARA